MIKKIEIERFSLITSSKPFDQVVATLNAAIGHPDMAEFGRSTHEARSFAELKSAVEKGLSKAGLMLFMQLDQGAVVRKETGQDTPRIIRLLIGNPLIKKEMAKHVPDAGSYAPVTVLVDERADGVHLSYDRMASFLAAYGNRDALQVAEDSGQQNRNSVARSGSLSVRLEVTLERKAVATQEDPMNADVLTTRVADGISVIMLGSAKRSRQGA
jgi:uncharacterized protein (DUF302 family)